MNGRKITKVIIGVVVIGSATAYLLYEAIESSWAYYLSVDEFVVGTSQTSDAGVRKIDKTRIVRLAGTVKAGGVMYDAEQMRLDFGLAGQKNSVPVRFHGAMPKNFSADKEVVVEGRVDANGVFQASEILTRCESKYKVKLRTKLSNSRYE